MQLVRASCTEGGKARLGKIADIRCRIHTCARIHLLDALIRAARKTRSVPQLSRANVNSRNRHAVLYVGRPSRLVFLSSSKNPLDGDKILR